MPVWSVWEGGLVFPPFSFLTACISSRKKDRKDSEDTRDVCRASDSYAHAPVQKADDQQLHKVGLFSVREPSARWSWLRSERAHLKKVSVERETWVLSLSFSAYGDIADLSSPQTLAPKSSVFWEKGNPSFIQQKNWRPTLASLTYVLEWEREYILLSPKKNELGSFSSGMCI